MDRRDGFRERRITSGGVRRCWVSSKVGCLEILHILKVPRGLRTLIDCEQGGRHRHHVLRYQGKVRTSGSCFQSSSATCQRSDFNFRAPAGCRDQSASSEKSLCDTGIRLPLGGRETVSAQTACQRAVLPLTKLHPQRSRVYGGQESSNISRLNRPSSLLWARSIARYPELQRFVPFPINRPWTHPIYHYSY